LVDVSVLIKRIRVSEIAALTVGSLYVSGYYINTMFVRNLGIAPTELIRLEYINIGLAFILITFAFFLLPISAFLLTYRVRRASGLPHFYAGLIGNSCNTTLCIGFPLFLALFATRYEWNLNLQQRLIGISTFSVAAGVAIGMAAIGMIALPVLERVLTRHMATKVNKVLYILVLEPLRFGILSICLYLIWELMRQVSWVSTLLRGGVTYFASALFLIGGVTAAVLWIKEISGVRRVWVVYGLVVLGGAAVYYMTLASYVLHIYPYLPSNRGGALPLTRAYFEITGHDSIFADLRIVGGTTLRGPGFIIEENDHTFFVASNGMDEWLTGFVPIHALRKDTIPYVYLERVDNGFPRVLPQSHATMLVRTDNPLTNMLLNDIFQVGRIFQYDYIYFDCVGLLIWLAVLWWTKQQRAILFGLLIAPIIYLIDAQIWWNTWAGSHYPMNVYIREYWIGGVQVPHPLGPFVWIKFGADFMMTISYSLFTFSWLYIAFQSVRNGVLLSGKLIAYTLLWLGIWLCVPLSSLVFHANDASVVAVRHMDSQFVIWLVNPVIGYALLLFVYRKRLRQVGYIALIGLLASLIMELPLYLFRIRQAGFGFLLFEGLFLVNQGVPYLFLVCDKIIPALTTGRRLGTAEAGK
jgi:hypothetical protein